MPDCSGKWKMERGNFINKIFHIVLPVLLLCLVSVFLTGCHSKEKNLGILFNSEPITKENFLQSSRNFEAGKKIYYLFYTRDKIKAEFIRVQLFKTGDNISVGGYSVLWAVDKRVMKQNQYYYTDSFTVYQPGRYVLQIFDVNNIAKPLTWNFFYVH